MQVPPVIFAVVLGLTLLRCAQTNALTATAVGSPISQGYGISVAQDRNGSCVVVGDSYAHDISYGSGNARIYCRTLDTWSLHGTLKSPSPQGDGNFGHRVAFGGDGRCVLVSEPAKKNGGTGVAYLFCTSTGLPASVGASSWELEKTFLPSVPNNNEYGAWLGVALDARLAFIDSGRVPGTDVFCSPAGPASGNWSFVSMVAPGIGFKMQALSESGTLLAVHTAHGMAVYRRGSALCDTWLLEAEVNETLPTGYQTSGTRAGEMAFTATENNLLVGHTGYSTCCGSTEGRGPGFVSVYDHCGDSWVKQTTLQGNASDEYGFGHSLACSGVLCVVGSVDYSLRTGGRVYIYAAADWSLLNILPGAARSGSNTLSLWSISLSLTRLVVGGYDVTAYDLPSAPQPVAPECPSSCPAGFFCSSPNSTQNCTTPGAYCPAGSTAEGTCPAGSFCSSSTATQNCTTPGAYCPAGSTAEGTCPAGSFCSSSTATQNCTTPGAYCPAGSTAEGMCPDGSFCGTANRRVQCTINQACPAGSSAALSCNSAQRYDNTSHTCVACPPFLFSSNSSSHVLTTCAHRGCPSSIQPFAHVGDREKRVCPSPNPNDPQDGRVRTCTSEGWTTGPCIGSGGLMHFLALLLLAATAFGMVWAAGLFITREKCTKAAVIGPFWFLVVFSVGDYGSDLLFFLFSPMYNDNLRSLCFLVLILSLLPAIYHWCKSLLLTLWTQKKYGVYDTHENLEKSVIELLAFPFRVVWWAARLSLGFFLFMGLWTSRLIAWLPSHAILTKVQGFQPVSLLPADLNVSRSTVWSTSPSMEEVELCKVESSAASTAHGDGPADHPTPVLRPTSTPEQVWAWVQHLPMVAPHVQADRWRKIEPSTILNMNEKHIALLPLTTGSRKKEEEVYKHLWKAIKQARKEAQAALEREKEESEDAPDDNAVSVSVIKRTATNSRTWASNLAYAHHLDLDRFERLTPAHLEDMTDDLADTLVSPRVDGEQREAVVGVLRKHINMVVTELKKEDAQGLTEFHVHRTVFNRCVVWELFLETLPQVAIQLYNALLLDKATPLFWLSIGFSSYMLARLLYEVAYKRCVDGTALDKLKLF